MHACSLRFDAFSVACQLWCVSIDFTYIYSVKLHVFPFPYHCYSVRFNFAHSCSLKLDVLNLPYLSRCFQLSFALIYKLRRDLFPFPCYFAHTCSLRLHVLVPHSILSLLKSILRIDIFHLPCHFTRVNHNFTQFKIFFELNTLFTVSLKIQ